MPEATRLDEDTRIIFVGFAEADDTGLCLDEEIEAIEGAFAGANMAGALPISAHANASTDTLHGALLAAKRAQVLHFSAHGHTVQGLLLYDAEGRPVLAAGSQLATLLGRFRNLRLVVLAGCHQDHQAEALRDIVDCVVATSGRINVDDSRQFMRAFYLGLAHGDSIGVAFETAKARIGIDAARASEQFWLIHREQINPAWVRLDPVRASAATAAEIEATGDWLERHVNSFEDVVITANVTDWRDAVPHKRSAAPPVFDIAVPDRQGGWQRDWPPKRDEWAAVAAEIERVAAIIREGDWKRVHLVVHLPFGLSALLAQSIEAMNHDVIIYQWTPPPKDADARRAWLPWGPGAPEAMPAPDDTPFFEPIDWPERPQPGFTGDLAITVGVSRPIAPELVRAAAPDRSRIRLVPLVPRGGASQAALDQRNIGRASAQLTDALSKGAAHYPNAAAIHLFVCAPKALLMRAALRLATSPLRVIVHEFYAHAEPRACYLPMTDLHARSIVEV